MYLRHRTVCGLAPELSQLGKRVAQWYAPFHRSPFLFLIKSISLSLSQSKLSCSHTLFICEIDEYQNSHDINPNPISPMLVQNRSFPSNHAVLWSTSLQTFAIVARQLSKYQLTKYPNYILYKLWGVPVVSVVVFSNKGNKGNHVFFETFVQMTLCLLLVTYLEHFPWTSTLWLQSVLSTEHWEDWYSVCQLEKREWIRI